MEVTPLTALSPLDGRYAAKAVALRPWFSEFALIRHRVQVEIEWLKALAQASQVSELAPFSAATMHLLDTLVSGFSPHDAARVKAIEATTNHDVKAIEYWLQERLAGNAEIDAAAGFIHFGCTSEDINNLAYALMLQGARATVLMPAIDAL